MAGLLVETDDFAAAAWALTADGGDPLGDALFTLHVSLSGCAGMAGSDPSGRGWAAGYDAAAGSALLGLRSLVNGCYRLSAMFAQTCRNYAAAEAASVPGAGMPADVAVLPADCSVSWDVSVPSAAGASAGGPPGWSLIAGLVGRVWPGGHQDRLRAAAAAWRRAAGAVDRAGARIRDAPDVLAVDRLPEQADIESVCLAVSESAARLVTAMEQAARSCDQLATELDRVHSEVAHELVSLVEQSAVIEGVGAFLGALSFGAAEAPTQVVEGARLETIALRVAELIDAFAAAAGELVAGLPWARDLADTVGRGLDELFASPLAVAGVTPVRTLAPELETVDGITSTEMTAERALAGESKISLEKISLRDEEAAGGHTIARHVGLSRETLAARNVRRSSSFNDLKTARSLTQDNLELNRPAVQSWLRGEEDTLVIEAPMPSTDGIVYIRKSQQFVQPSDVRTVLERRPDGGYLIKTSFPVVRN